MAKLIGRRQGLDQKKLAALEKVLKEVGINQKLRINSGLRDRAEVMRIYNQRLGMSKYGNLSKVMKDLPEGSKKAIRERILRVADNTMKLKYPRHNWKSGELVKQLVKDGMSSKEAKKIAKNVGDIRTEFGGFQSGHLRGEKIDIDRKLLRRPEVIDKMVEKGYVILDEISNEATGKGIFDISFPQPGRKGSYKRAGDKKDLSGPEMLRDEYLDNQRGVVRKPFKQAFEEARAAGKKEFTWRGNRYNTLRKEDLVKEEDLRGPEMQRDQYLEDQVDLRGPEMQRDQYLEDQDDDLTEEIIKIKEEARKPKQEIDAKDIELEQTIPMDQSVPFGVFAQGQPEFEMAEEQEKEKLMMAAEGGEVYDEGEEGKIFGKGRVARILGKNPERGEVRVRGGGKEGRKNRAFDRLSDEAKKLPFLIGGDPKEGTAVFKKFDPKKDQDYYGVGIEGGYERLSESEGPRRGQEDTRSITKDVMRVSDPVFKVKQYRDPKTGKIVKYVAPEEDKPFEEGGAFPRRRSISITGGRRKGDFAIPEASEFRNREVAERLSKISPYERLEGEGMTYGRDSAEFGTELYDSPRSFADMPEKSRRGLRRMAQYGDAGDLELRSFAEAFNKASEVDKAKLAKANPELFQEAKEQYGFNKGGEVESKRFISSLPFETRKKLANEELDEIGFRRIKEARKKRDSKGFQAARVLPEEVESIEKKYGVFGEMSDEEQIQGFQTGGEVDDVPEFLRRPPEDRQPEDFRIQDVTEMDVEEPEPKPMPEPEPDLSGPEFDRDQYLMEQKSTRELLDYGIPGEDRPLAVNRELIRRKQEAGSGFEVGKGPTLEEIAAGEEEEARREEAKQRKEVNRQKRERDKANKIVVEDKSQKELDEAELRKAIDDSIVQAEKTAQSIDPKRFFKKMSTFDKIVGLIGLAAGAYESYKYGGPNFYEKEIEKEVEKDIKLQKLGLEDEKRKLGVANFKVAQIAKKLAMSTKNEEQRIRLLQTVQKFQQAGAKQAAAAQKQKGLMNVNFILNTRGITDAEMAKFDSMYSGLKIRANSIKGRDGLNYFVRGGPSNMAKVKAYLADAQDSIDGLTDLYSYFDKISIVDQAVPIFSIDAAEAQSLRDRLVGKLRIEFFGPGVMTDSERAQAKKILGDPNALMTTDSREKPKILKLIMKLNYGVRDKLRRDGVAIQKTPNDLRIEQMLNRRKLQDNAKNRRFVIDALIQGEIDAQKAGKAPGSLWNMNEPLPV